MSHDMKDLAIAALPPIRNTERIPEIPIHPFPSVTLVAACFVLSRFHPYCRTEEEWMAHMDPLLRMPVYLIIHCDSTMKGISEPACPERISQHVHTNDVGVCVNMYEQMRAKRSEYGFDAYTVYVQERFEDLWSAQYVDQVKSNRAVYWPTADQRTCAESHLVCCNKFDFVLQAIEQNPFRTERFGWIDSCLALDDQNIRIAENYTTNMVPRILSQITDDKFHIQVLNVNDKRFLLPEHKREYYETYRWVVCGGFFVCGPEVGRRILQRLKHIFHDTTMAGYGHGEEMCYLEILEEFADNVVKSYGDYRQILNNFISPTRNIGYIVDFIIERYFSHQYYRECMECCRAVLASFDQFLVPMDYVLYMRTLRIYHTCVEMQTKNALQEKMDMWSKMDSNIRGPNFST